MIVGIGPGFEGAIAFLGPNGLKVHDMPVFTAPKGKTEINLHALGTLLIPRGDGRNIAVIEQVAAMTKQGVSSVSRRRARMLRITSAEWTPSLSASAQAASTVARPSVSAALRISTIWRSPPGAPSSFLRTRFSDDGSTQSLKGAPLRRAPGLRTRAGT